MCACVRAPPTHVYAPPPYFSAPSLCLRHPLPGASPASTGHLDTPARLPRPYPPPAPPSLIPLPDWVCIPRRQAPRGRHDDLSWGRTLYRYRTAAALVPPLSSARPVRVPGPGSPPAPGGWGKGGWYGAWPAASRTPSSLVGAGAWPLRLALASRGTRGVGLEPEKRCSEGDAEGNLRGGC
jgi:hypothetical protein